MNLDEAIGRRVRELRGPKTQEQVAAEARALGLDWSRNVVAALELGARELSPAELLLLPIVLQRVTGKRVELADLVPGDGLLSAGARSLPRAVLRKILAGRAIDVKIDQTPALTRAQRAAQDERGEAERKAAAKLGVEPRVLALAARMRYGRSFSDERDARIDPSGLSARSLQARRGHVTRELLKELDPVIMRRSQDLGGGLRFVARPKRRKGK